jgi:tRNA (cytidine/uridine-2'-O-)-methyltransferase
MLSRLQRLKAPGPALRSCVVPMRLALFEPDIPQNTGAMLRLAACLGVSVDLIEPCGFVWSDRRLRRAGMDYLEGVDLMRHPSWAAYQAGRAALSQPGRLVLLTTRGDRSYQAFEFRPSDTLMVGRESAGVPDEVHQSAESRVVIPMVAGPRSLNVALAAAIVLGEALRQTGQLPAAGLDVAS